MKKQRVVSIPFMSDEDKAHNKRVIEKIMGKPKRRYSAYKSKGKAHIGRGRGAITIIAFVIMSMLSGCLFDADFLSVRDVETASFYQISPSYNITLQLPDELETDLGKIFHEETSYVGYDLRRQYAACGFAINSTRIFVPDCSVQNIYVFNHQGEYLPDENITREPYYEAGVYVPRWGHRDSDGREWFDVDEDYAYAVIDYDAGHTWVYKNLVKIDIASGEIVREYKKVKGNDFFMHGDYIYRRINETGTIWGRVPFDFHAIDKHTLTESPENDFEHHTEEDIPLILEHISEYRGIDAEKEWNEGRQSLLGFNAHATKMPMYLQTVAGRPFSDGRFIWFHCWDTENDLPTQIAFDPIANEWTDYTFIIETTLVHQQKGYLANNTLYFKGTENYTLHAYK